MIEKVYFFRLRREIKLQKGLKKVDSAADWILPSVSTLRGKKMSMIVQKE